MEALQTAAYMRNRTAHSKFKSHKSPYQKLTSKKPQLERMHIFGCRVSVLNSAPALKSKLVPRSKLGYFLGYPTDTAGYRVLLDNGKVVESSDIIFFDNTVLASDIKFFLDSVGVHIKTCTREEVS
jgi:hypothetical protein